VQNYYKNLTYANISAFFFDICIFFCNFAPKIKNKAYETIILARLTRRNDADGLHKEQSRNPRT
jgi:hypothetical protein